MNRQNPTYWIAASIFMGGWLFGLVFAFLFFESPKDKTIARLEAERDSLLAVKTPMREVGAAISMPSNSQVLIRAEQKDEKLTFRYWDIPLTIWKQDKNGEPYAWIIYGDSIGRWPPETLKTTPMKRREK